MATVLFNPLYFSIDGNGVPRAGATLTFSQTGTSTPQNTFTDSSLGTPNANPVVADSNGLFPPIYLSASFDYKVILKDAAANTIATRDPIGYVPAGGTLTVPMPSYLNGLTLSTAGGTGTFSVAAGSAADTTNASLMKLAASISKTTAAWVAGAGAGSLDTGAIANTTWYHVHLIQRTDTGVVDVLTSLSATTPTMPANYSLFRRIGSMKTDSSAHWVAFVQDGDLFQWAAFVQDINSVNPGTSAVTRTLASVPTGVSVLANFQLIAINSSNGVSLFVYTSDLATNDIASSTTVMDISLAFNAAGGDQYAAGVRTVRTNTSAQIRSRLANSDGSCSITINTLGWIDRRGRDV